MTAIGLVSSRQMLLKWNAVAVLADRETQPPRWLATITAVAPDQPDQIARQGARKPLLHHRGISISSTARSATPLRPTLMAMAEYLADYVHGIFALPSCHRWVETFDGRSPNAGTGIQPSAHSFGMVGITALVDQLAVGELGDALWPPSPSEFISISVSIGNEPFFLGWPVVNMIAATGHRHAICSLDGRFWHVRADGRTPCVIHAGVGIAEVFVGSEPRVAVDALNQRAARYWRFNVEVHSARWAVELLPWISHRTLAS